MLDKRCFALLEYVNSECLNAGYKVFSLEQIIENLPVKLGVDKDILKESFNVLSQREYVSVKYIDDEEVCVSPLTEGRLVFERRIEDKMAKARAEKRCFFFGAMGGFIGGSLGSLAWVIISLLTGAR